MNQRRLIACVALLLTCGSVVAEHKEVPLSPTRGIGTTAPLSITCQYQNLSALAGGIPFEIVIRNNGSHEQSFSIAADKIAVSVKAPDGTFHTNLTDVGTICFVGGMSADEKRQVRADLVRKSVGYELKDVLIGNRHVEQNEFLASGAVILPRGDELKISGIHRYLKLNPVGLAAKRESPPGLQPIAKMKHGQYRVGFMCVLKADSSSTVYRSEKVEVELN